MPQLALGAIGYSILRYVLVVIVVDDSKSQSVWYGVV